MSTGQELAVVAQQHIELSNNNYFTQAKKQNITVYGDIAALIEGHAGDFSEAAEMAARYLAQCNDARLAQKYEESSTLFEKIVRNNPIKMGKYGATQDFQRSLINNGVQVLVHGIEWGAKKGLMALEKRKVYENIWFLCHIYAHGITHGNIGGYRPVGMLINSISRDTMKQYYNKLSARPEKCPTSLSDFNSVLLFPKDERIQENIAFTLYLLYAAKHGSPAYENKRAEDLQQLLYCWSILGYAGDYAALFDKFEKIGDANIPEYNRNAQALEGFYYNLMTTLPSIDRGMARRLDRELLSYIPNGDTQAMTRAAGKFAAKTGLIAAGALTENPVLLKVAAASATSLFKDLSGTETIGNILKLSGVQDKDVRECLVEAKKIQKQLDAPI